MIYVLSTTIYSNVPEVKQTSKNEITSYLAYKTYKKEPIGLDTETEGIFNFNNKVLTIQIGDKDNQFFIDCRGLDMSFLKRYLESKDLLKIGQNLKFDYKFLRYSFGITLENIYDTMLAEGVLMCGLKAPMSLQAIASKYCNIELDKSTRSSFSKHKDGIPFTLSQIQYAVKDVAYLHEIREKQLKLIEKDKLTKVLNLENNAALAVADIEYNGMFLDKDSWLKVATESSKEMSRIENNLDELVLSNSKLSHLKVKYVQSSLFDSPETLRLVNIKWSSQAQVLPVFKLLEPSLEAVNEKEIAKFQNKHEIIKKYIDYKKAQKKATTYGKNFLKYINKTTARVHTVFWQVLNTGRMSSGSKPNKKKKTREDFPNMQNIPADNRFLSCFKAKEGYTYVICDYKAQELTLTAEASKEPSWRKAISEGEDLHGIVASVIFNIDISKVKDKPSFLRGKSYRDVAKNINFMLIYGGSEFKLANTLSMTVKEAKKYIDKYFSALPTLSNFLDRMAEFGRNNFYIKTMHPFGRIRRFPIPDANSKDYYKETGSIERQSKNTVIQGSGADITKLALIYIREYINKNNYPASIVLTIHDSIICEVRDDRVEEWGQIQSELMILAGKEVVRTLPVNVDVTISKEWIK